MDLKYTKREGTSGMSGQLYEINLISLILFRLQHDDSIEMLHLASNMDEIGSFDDICIRIKINGHHHPVLVFIQAKHKDNDDTSLSYDLIKHFHTSYVKVKDKFHLNKDIFFKEKFEDTECVFILYTNAKYYTNQVLHRDVAKQARKPYNSNISAKLNQLLATGDENTQGYQEDFADEDLEFVNERILKEEITILAEHFAKFLNDKTNQSINIMLDKYMLKYHVILAETVVDISEVYSDEKKSILWRYMTFRPTFFYSEDNILKMLKMKICEQIFKTQVMSKKSEVNKGAKDTSQSSILNSEESTVDKLIASFLSEPSALTLSPLIGTHIIYKNGKLDFISERPLDKPKILQEINISPLIIDEAAEISARNILLSVKLKVPVTFGNRDMTLSGNLKKIEKRINTLTDFIADLCKKSQLVNKYRTVVIDESVGDGFLSLNNGIGSTVGNLLIYDNATKRLKFTDDFTLLPKNAKAFYDCLNNKIGVLDVYRFDVQTITFPKLVFCYSNEAKTILKTVVVYERQSNYSNVEVILKKEIEYNLQSHGPHNLPVRSDTVVTEYHKMILKWWMSPNGTYLTKAKNIYQEALNNIIKEPQISAMQTTFSINSLNYMSYDFSKSAMEFLISRGNNSSIIIVTDITMLTTVKVIQYYGNDTKYVVLALEYMLNLSIKDFAALISELENTESLPILVCNNIKNSRTVYKRIDKLATATEDKRIIIITNSDFLETTEEYFLNAQVINDEHSLNHFTTASQRDIIKKVEVIFQGEEVSLNLLLVDAPVEFIKGDVLNKIICNQTIMIGKSLSNSRYEEIKHLYIDRRVIQTRDEDEHTEELTNNIRAVRTFYDINDDVVLITAKPGMGKSTLLTHLSVTTKKWDRTIWIIRINLLEYSKVFYDWTVTKPVLDNVKTIKFVCKTIINNNELKISLKEINNKVYLDGCTGDEWATFELNMFLHFYNEKKILFLFDGFDEICPFYKETFINFLNIVKKYPGEHKMWVTSRPYSEILPDLEKALGKAYEIEHINDEQQDVYLRKFWEDRILRLNFNNDQLKDMITYLDQLLFSIPSGFLSLWKEQDRVHYNLYRICRHLLHYLQTLILIDDIKGSIPFAASDDSDNKQEEEIFLGSPLLLYLLADYFVNLLDRAVYSNSRLTFGPGETINIHKVYEGFIDIKLKKILFQDKNKMDIYIPDIMMKCEKERAECYDMHKKLAAHVMLRDSLLHEECSLDEFKDMRPFEENSAEYNTIINRVKTGIEKTGLISYVTVDNIPVFIHRTFAEYFAAEYVWDILKGNKFNYNSKKLLFYAVLFFNTKNVFPWLITEDGVRKEPSLIKLDTETFGFHHCVALFNHRLWSIEQLIRLMASSPIEDFENDYLNKWIDTLYDREDDYRETHISNFINNIVANMKPHLKRYFTSDGWPVNSTANFSIRYPSTQLRRHLNIIFKEYELFPISCF